MGLLLNKIYLFKKSYNIAGSFEDKARISSQRIHRERMRERERSFVGKMTRAQYI